MSTRTLFIRSECNTSLSFRNFIFSKVNEWKFETLTDIYDTTQGKVELLQSLGEDTPIGKFLLKKGPGVHHVCFEVDDINKAIKELKELNIQVLSDTPTVGAEGYKVVFIHPKSTGGVLVELAEKP